MKDTICDDETLHSGSGAPFTASIPAYIAVELGALVVGETRPNDDVHEVPDESEADI